MKDKGRLPIETIRASYRESFHRNPQPGVAHLLGWIEEQRLALHDKAEREPDPNISNNLIKEAKGMYSVIEHINSLVRDTKVTNRSE